MPNCRIITCFVEYCRNNSGRIELTLWQEYAWYNFGYGYQGFAAYVYYNGAEKIHVWLGNFCNIRAIFFCSLIKVQQHKYIGLLRFKFWRTNHCRHGILYLYVAEAFNESNMYSTNRKRKTL